MILKNKFLFIFIIISFIFTYAVAYSAEVKDEQQKLKSAIEKAKNPIDAAKEILPSIPSSVKSEQKGNVQQQAGQPGVDAQQPQHEIVEYVYIGKRDPFMPLIKQETDKKKGSSPMESFMVSDIKVVGILERNAQYFAQIVLPDGKSYTIKEGQKLGLMGGVVSRISKDSVVIKEKAIDAEGKPTFKNINIRLRKEEDE